MNVLLVDDESNLRKMVRLMLQKNGHQVFDTASGVDALRVFGEQPIDVLVTDIVMDDMDGAALAEALVGRNPALPVLFMSGYPQRFANLESQFSRCAFLPKPFQKSELLDAITELRGA